MYVSELCDIIYLTNDEWDTLLSEEYLKKCCSRISNLRTKLTLVRNLDSPTLRHAKEVYEAYVNAVRLHDLDNLSVLNEVMTQIKIAIEISDDEAEKEYADYASWYY